MTRERILIVEDDRMLREILTRGLRSPERAVHGVGSAEEALAWLEHELPTLVVTDLRLPGADGVEVVRTVKARAAQAERIIPVLLVSAVGEVSEAVRAMEQGAFHYTVKSPETVNDVRFQVERMIQHRDLLEENRRLRADLKKSFESGGMIGRSPAMQRVRAMVERVAGTRINCVILGESGSGKEVVARAIHEAGDRARMPFVAVNCGAIPDNLFESELFGYRKGAFTGADRDRKGAFEAADGGTLFLDEVGELPLPMQVKLLRVLQDRKVTPLGTTAVVPVDVRILAATNRDLQRDVNEGRFREDLFYRLNVVQIDVPPLRERRDDLVLLAGHFIQKFNAEFGRQVEGLSPDAERALLAYGFPGNVRELQNVVERAVALEERPRISVASLPERVREGHVLLEATGTEPEVGVPGFDLDAVLTTIERGYLERALRQTNGNRTRAARLLGINFRSMRHRLQKYGLDVGELADEEPSGTRGRPGSLPPTRR